MNFLPVFLIQQIWKIILKSYGDQLVFYNSFLLKNYD